MYVLPNTLLTEKFKDITQLYKKGSPVPVSENVKSLAEAAMNDLKWSQTKQKLIKIYTGYGFDLFNAGTFMLFAKGVLGIPKNFQYGNIEDFDKTGILVKNEPVHWDTPAGKALKESLVFSDEAKKFAIARELAYLETGAPFGYGIFSASVIVSCYAISSHLNRKLNMFHRPRTLRALMYTAVSLFTYTSWVLCKDVACVSFEADVDKTVADISESYAKGGLEFYEKILQRNIALRSLMGEDGEKLFTAYGNDQVLFRTKHIPYNVHREYMKGRVEEYAKAEKMSVKQDEE
ncbi:transmembrane protein 177 isoform X2 [Palaemon carinicauda]